MSNDNPKLRKNGGKGTGVGNFLRSIGKGGILKTAANIVGKATGIPFLNAVNNLIQTDGTITQEQKAEASKHYQMDIEAEQAQDKERSVRWSSDMTSDSWMSKNIRPLILGYCWLLFTIFIVGNMFNKIVLPTEYLSVFKKAFWMVNAAYFGDRAIRGITTTIKKNK